MHLENHMVVGLDSSIQKRISFLLVFWKEGRRRLLLLLSYSYLLRWNKIGEYIKMSLFYGYISRKLNFRQEWIVQAFLQSVPAKLPNSFYFIVTFLAFGSFSLPERGQFLELIFEIQFSTYFLRNLRFDFQKLQSYLHVDFFSTEIRCLFGMYAYFFLGSSVWSTCWMATVTRKEVRKLSGKKR